MKKPKVETSTSSKLDGIPNIRFFLLGEVYALGIAAALNVGHAIVAPAVLIVADQQPIVIRRQRRLPGTCCEELNPEFENQQIDIHGNAFRTHIASWSVTTLTSHNSKSEAPTAMRSSM
jgi:hypothetical protein